MGWAQWVGRPLVWPASIGFSINWCKATSNKEINKFGHAKGESAIRINWPCMIHPLFLFNSILKNPKLSSNLRDSQNPNHMIGKRPNIIQINKIWRNRLAVGPYWGIPLGWPSQGYRALLERQTWRPNYSPNSQNKILKRHLRDWVKVIWG